MKKGEIVLTPFPFTDLSQTKLRPAVVLCTSFSGSDTTLCFISSRNLDNLDATEFLIETSDADFTQTGLKVSSKVRTTRLVTLEQRLITRKLGQLSPQYIQKLDTALIQAFQLFPE